MKRLFTLLFLLPFLLNAQLFVENFNYTSTGVAANDSLTNPAIGGAIWKKHSGAFLTNYIKFVTPGLTYAGYAGSNVGGAATMAHISSSAEDLNAAVGPFTADSVYGSFILNVTTSGGTTGDYNFSFGASAGTTVTDLKGRIFFKDGSTANTFKVGISKSGTATAATFSTADYPVGTPVLVVLKYKIVSGTLNDEASIYVFTSGVPSTEPIASAIIAPDNATGADLGSTGVASICLRQGTVGAGACTLDGIRVANAWYNAPLPISLGKFTASLVNGKSSLNWSTSNETNINSFAVEKSRDATNFSQLDIVAAKNAPANNYTYTDAVAATGTSFYRLKMIEKDGSFKYSAIVALNAKQSIKLDVFPNPTINTAILSHTKSGEKAIVRIVDITGKTLIAQNVQSNATQSSIDVSKLVKGTYIVVFENEGATSAARLIKQ